MANYRLKMLVLEVLDNQLRMNNPKCTKKTLKRLMSLGYTEAIAKEMIAAVLLEDIYDILNSQKPFNEKKYAKKLNKLS